MVLLLERLTKLYSKMENHHNHHHHSQALSASLQAFRFHLSNCVNQLLSNSNSNSNSKPGLENWSLLWIQRCFELLPMINKAFAKLVLEIDYAMNKWESDSIEEYLNFSLNLLELLNSISSSLSNLGQARLSLSHALSLVENSPSLAIKKLKPIQLKSLSKDFKEQESKKDGEERFCSGEERFCSGKEWIILQALKEMKSIGFWVCGIVLAGLCGDANPYLELRKSTGGFVNSSLIGLDSSICKEIMEKRFMLKEVKEMNDEVAGLVVAMEIGKSSKSTKELQRKLEEFEKLLEELGKEGNHLFSEVLAGRNELLDNIRRRKHLATTA